jgi:hypothetical protein
MRIVLKSEDGLPDTGSVSYILAEFQTHRTCGWLKKHKQI